MPIGLLNKEDQNLTSAPLTQQPQGVPQAGGTSQPLDVRAVGRKAARRVRPEQGTHPIR